MRGRDSKSRCGTQRHIRDLPRPAATVRLAAPSWQLLILLPERHPHPPSPALTPAWPNMLMKMPRRRCWVDARDGMAVAGPGLQVRRSFSCPRYPPHLVAPHQHPLSRHHAHHITISRSAACAVPPATVRVVTLPCPPVYAGAVPPAVACTRLSPYPTCGSSTAAPCLVLMFTHRRIPSGVPHVSTCRRFSRVRSPDACACPLAAVSHIRMPTCRPPALVLDTCSCVRQCNMEKCRGEDGMQAGRLRYVTRIFVAS